MPHKTSVILPALIALLLFVSGCATTAKQVVTRGEAFPQLYKEHPHSIVVLPPLNTSSIPEAVNYYMATIEVPLSAAGYHILPAETVTDIIKQRKLHDTESLYVLPLETLNKYFGTDAVFYTHIKQWDIAKTGLISRLIISVETELISTKTSKQLWRYNSSINVDLNTVKSTGGSVMMLLKSMQTDVDEATAHSIACSLKLNTKLTRDLPFGPEHENYLQDQKIDLIGTIPVGSLDN